MESLFLSGVLGLPARVSFFVCLRGFFSGFFHFKVILFIFLVKLKAIDDVLAIVMLKVKSVNPQGAVDSPKLEKLYFVWIRMRRDTFTRKWGPI